jgi:hypothetical protein
MYKKWLRQELEITNVKVKKWVDWDPDSNIYEAFIESRRVVIPKPVDDWSFLVALHELGHVSTGERIHSYLSEYNAEKWAIKRAKESYQVQCLEYEEDARIYVKKHLIENLIFTELALEKVKPYVLDWLGETKESILKHVLAIMSHTEFNPRNRYVDFTYWNKLEICN